MAIKFSYRTKPYKTTIYVLISFVVFLLIWLLVGDMNLLNVEWLIPKNGLFWTGKVTDTNIDWLINHYKVFDPDISSELHIGTNVQLTNKTGNIIFNVNILFCWLGGLIFCGLLPLFGRLIKFNNWDVYPFVLSMSLSGIIFCITGLIDYWVKQAAWWYLLRLFIFVISLVIFFLFFNWIFGFIFKKAKYQGEYISELMITKKMEDKINKSGSEVIDTYLKDKKEKEITYVEVDDKDKK